MKRWLPHIRQAGMSISDEFGNDADGREFTFEWLGVLLQVAILRRSKARKCRECGCTDSCACVDVFGHGCYWVEPDLCSECRNKLVYGTSEELASVFARAAQQAGEAISKALRVRP